MKKMFLLFSHKLNEEQRRDAKINLKVDEFVKLDDRLQNLWSNIPPDIESLNEILQPIKDFLTSTSKKGDIALIQGDFGAVHEMVCFCKGLKLIPYYATTKRIVSEEIEEGKIVKKSIFQHRRFRKYGV